MSVDEERVIALSRAKLALTTAGALLMAAAGVWFFVASDDGSLVTTLGRFVPPWVVHALGLAAALFGTAGAVYGVRKSFDREPGLTLGPRGLVDNSSAVAAGVIPWSEITGLDTFEMHNQKMLVVHVGPAKYVERGSALKRALNRANMGMCGSPIVISSNALQIPFDELRNELAAYLSRYGGRIGGELRPRADDPPSHGTGGPGDPRSTSV
jgi:hypothetical protein